MAVIRQGYVVQVVQSSSKTVSWSVSWSLDGLWALESPHRDVKWLREELRPDIVLCLGYGQAAGNTRVRSVNGVLVLPDRNARAVG